MLVSDGRGEDRNPKRTKSSQAWRARSGGGVGSGGRGIWRDGSGWGECSILVEQRPLLWRECEGHGAGTAPFAGLGEARHADNTSLRADHAEGQLDAEHVPIAVA